MHVVLSRDGISRKLTDPHMLWWQEFPEWLQRLSGRKEHVRHIKGFEGADTLDLLSKTQHI